MNKFIGRQKQESGHSPEATCKESLQVQNEGKRQVKPNEFEMF